MFLGIDIGTTNVKAVVVDEAQSVVASATAALPISHPQALWSEQDPRDWWAGVEAALAGLRARAGHAFAAVRSIGLSGQMHSLVLLGEDGRPLRPAILHNDGRSFAEARALNQAVKDFGTIAGVPAMPGFTAPKLLWLRRHEPEVMARARHLLLPKDYIRFRMTGSFATDMCDGSGSVILDSGRRAWSPEIAAACGIDVGLLPQALEGTAVAGELRRDVAEAWGLEPGIAVAAGTGDAAAGAIGIGAIREGDAFISLGTAAQYFITRQSYAPRPGKLIHTFCHGLPGHWFQMAAILNGASPLAWVAEVLGEADVGKLLDAAEARYKGPSAVLFLPYLSGERTPLDDPLAKGVFFGLTASTTREDMVQAVIEGVALSLADCQTYLEETGPLPGAIGMSGGGSKSGFWMRIMAAVLGRTLELYAGGETGPAFGAARLARLAVTGESPARVCTKPQAARTVVPDPELQQAYAPRLARFRALYQALKPQFAAS